MGLIYCLTSPSGRKYVGKTQRSLMVRINEHSSRASEGKSPLKSAIVKYGMDAFQKEILADDIDDSDLLSLLEIEWIAKLSSEGNKLYNLTIGGEGLVGYVHTDTAREKMRKASAKNNNDPEVKLRRGASIKRSWKENPERRAATSNRMKKKWQEEEYRSIMEKTITELERTEFGTFKNNSEG